MMQPEIRFATFNVCNLAPVGVQLYDNLAPLSLEEYDAKANWTARQIDMLDADVIGFQEIFSQAALRDVLSRTHRYAGAVHAGFDPDPNATRLTPNVALVSRLPLAAPPLEYPAFPAGVTSDSGNPDADRFARAPLHVAVVLPNGVVADVVVVHLKSRRPDYRNGDGATDPLQYAMANLRSLVWRGTEAVALRVLLSNLMKEQRRPCIVMGDFNDTADAVTTTIVMGNGAGWEGGEGQEGAGGAEGGASDALRGGMFDSAQIQRRQDQLRHMAYTTMHEGRYSTIDHVLVSEAFHPGSPRAIAEVVDVVYLNDHLADPRPETSDHGLVRVRIRLKG